MWENVVDYNRPQMRHVLITCWITKASETHSEYVIPVDFQDNSGYANATEYYVYTYTVCLVHFIAFFSNFKPHLSWRHTRLPISPI
jgi:hypothetical protein